MGSDQCSEGSNVFREILDTARNLGAELTVNVAGYLTFGLSTLTNGFLPDMDFELFDSAIIITTGGGATGLTTGVYISVENNLAQSVVDLCLNLFNHFSGIFSSFGVSSPNVDIASLHFGLYVDASSVGFKFLIGGDAFMCMYKFTNGKGACQYKLSFFTALIEGAKWVIKKAAQLWDETGKVLAEFGAMYKFTNGKGACQYKLSFFTALIEGAKWVIKKASQLFDEAGEVLAEFGANTAQFATDSANAVANFAEEQVYNEIRDETLAAANTMENAGKQAWESATNTAQKLERMGQSLQEDYNKYVSDVGNMISGFSGKIEDVIVDMTNDVKAIGNPEFGANTAQFATDSANAVANFAEEEVYNEIRDGTLAAANTMENTGKEAWESATSTAQKIENMGKSLQEDYNNYVSDVGNMISGFSGKIEDVIVDMTNDVKAIGNQVGSGISNAATSAGNEIVKVFKKNKW
eukprot:CAMPEP_0170535710 /NCGR_PEP_ID=MMETSP0209-20121228/101748_1 /TAXON_ID=665100 ORGANISM="Litonotus pictus, Strain P1" /NCGR_SAMPLE_ID=MMETSP0209 /ASSEMBLY_ACC=CAM_ASM_000301 /LENGTH=465 /DNA_ID=CAMNT_0010837005 /DNA_START=1 /DNA_END=1398 /DNA_ORIENTATION=-